MNIIRIQVQCLDFLCLSPIYGHLTSYKYIYLKKNLTIIKKPNGLNTFLLITSSCSLEDDFWGNGNQNWWKGDFSYLVHNLNSTPLLILHADISKKTKNKISLSSLSPQLSLISSSSLWYQKHLWSFLYYCF